MITRKLTGKQREREREKRERRDQEENGWNKFKEMKNNWENKIISMRQEEVGAELRIIPRPLKRQLQNRGEEEEIGKYFGDKLQNKLLQIV